MVVWDAAAKSLKWEFHPTSLLDALWLQLGQALTAGAQIRQCGHCSDWFKTGPAQVDGSMPSSALTNTV